MNTNRKIFYAFAIVALVMNFMIQITPLWLSDDGAQSFEICTTQGIETVTIDKDGNEAPAPDLPKHDCPFCLAYSTALLDTQISGTLSTPSDLRYIRYSAIKNQAAFNTYPNYGAHLTRAPPYYS